MKKVSLLALCFLISTTCAYAELSQSDFEKFQSIIDKSEKQIKEYIDLKINALDAKLSGDIKALDERLSGDIKALDAKLSGEIKALDGRINQLFWLMISIIALIAVAVGMPYFYVGYVGRQGKAIQSENEQIEALQQEIEAMRHEMNERNLSTT